MLVFDSTKQCAYTVVNQYIKRRQLNQKLELILEELIEDEELRQKVFDHFDQTQANVKRTFKNESTITMPLSESRGNEQRQSRESNFLV